MINPPIFVDDNGDLTAFKTIISAEEWLEPYDKDDAGRFVYDCDGRLLKQVLVDKVVDNRLLRLLGISGPVASIKLEPFDEVPQHIEELASKLKHFLLHRGRDSNWLDAATLPHLVDAAIACS